MRSAHHTELETAMKTSPDGMAQRVDSEFSVPMQTSSFFTTGPSSQCPVPAQSANPLIDTPRRRHISDISKQRRRDKLEILIQNRPLRVQAIRCSRRADNKRNTAPGPKCNTSVEMEAASVYIDAVPDLDEPRPKRRHLGTSSKKKSRRDTFEMLIQKRALRVQAVRCSRRADKKGNTAPTSQEYFKIDVPKWSDYFSTDSSCDVTVTRPLDKKKIYTSVEMMKTNSSPAQSARPIAQAKYRLHGAPCPQRSLTDRSEEMKVCIDAVPDLDEPSPKCCRLDPTQKKCRRDKFEMLIQKRALRVQAVRCSRRADKKGNTAPTSQEYFKIDVPKWSDYFSTDSSCDVTVTRPLDKKKICWTQAEYHPVQTPDNSHSSDTSQKNSTDKITNKRLLIRRLGQPKREDTSSAPPPPPDLKKKICWTQSEFHPVQTPNSHSSDTSQKISTEKITEKRLLIRRLGQPKREDTSSAPPPPPYLKKKICWTQSECHPVQTPNSHSSDTSQKRSTEKITKKSFFLRRLGQPKREDTPRARYPSPSDGKNISSPQRQNAKDRPTNTQYMNSLAPKPARPTIYISSHGPRINTLTRSTRDFLKQICSSNFIPSPASICTEAYF